MFGFDRGVYWEIIASCGVYSVDRHFSQRPKVDDQGELRPNSFYPTTPNPKALTQHHSLQFSNQQHHIPPSCCPTPSVSACALLESFELLRVASLQPVGSRFFPPFTRSLVTSRDQPKPHPSTFSAPQLLQNPFNFLESLLQRLHLLQIAAKMQLARPSRKTNGDGVQVEETQICVVMVGLPARGKSLIAQKGNCHLYINWQMNLTFHSSTIPPLALNRGSSFQRRRIPSKHRSSSPRRLLRSR